MSSITRVTQFAAGLLLLLSLPATKLLAQQLDPSFHLPVFGTSATQNSTRIGKVLRQANGRYLIEGDFPSVDGHPTIGLARLLPDGYVDTTFTSTSGYVLKAVQADGKLLVLGYNNGYILKRLLPSGQPDMAFHPALQRSGFFDQVLVQPDGKILLAGMVTDSLGRGGLVRLLPSGRVDVSFMASFTLPVGTFSYTSVVLEPTGRILFATCVPTVPSTGSTVTRLLPTGRVDSTFVYTAPLSVQINKLALCPNGSYAIGGLMGNGTSVGRLLPSGALDASFQFSLNIFSIYVGFSTNIPLSTVAVLPDGRILACGNMLQPTTPYGFTGAPLLRSQQQGGDDVTWNPNFIYTYYISYGFVSNIARVNDLLVEPSGKVLVAGQFVESGGVAHNGLARLLAATPLAARPASAAAKALIWPVPAHEQLQVQLPAGMAAQQLELLDVIGRIVLTQPPTGAVTSINTAAYLPGLYVLRIRNTDGSATSQRVVLE